MVESRRCCVDALVRAIRYQDVKRSVFYFMMNGCSPLPSLLLAVLAFVLVVRSLRISITKPHPVVLYGLLRRKWRWSSTAVIGSWLVACSLYLLGSLNSSMTRA